VRRCRQMTNRRFAISFTRSAARHGSNGQWEWSEMQEEGVERRREGEAGKRGPRRCSKKLTCTFSRRLTMLTRVGPRVEGHGTRRRGSIARCGSTTRPALPKSPSGSSAHTCRTARILISGSSTQASTSSWTRVVQACKHMHSAKAAYSTHMHMSVYFPSLSL